MNIFNVKPSARKHLLLALILFLCTAIEVKAQNYFLETNAASQAWVDRYFKKLSRNEKIAQLMVVRLSERKGKEAVFYDKEVGKYVRRYNIGSVCLFQGNSPKQATVINALQAKAETPIMVCVDGETGVGMRFGDVAPFPDQLTIGAVGDAAIAYKVGKAIAEQCKRIGIHVDYAPVVDINNNPNNPVINFRSFGEDKYKVASLGTQMMKGMQDGGIMACAKHFPGHGDVAVDSHYDLPVINKSMQSLDSLELYPFKELIKAGVGSMMVAHLYIPAIDTTTNQATSLSKKNVTGLLRNQLGYQGLTFTDALEMKGVSKFYPQGEAAVQSLIAGNDMLCLPGDVKGSIRKVRKAIRKDRLTWNDIDEKVRKVLLSKYHLGLDNLKPIDTTSIAADLNADVPSLKKEVYENAITLLKQSDIPLLPLNTSKRIAFVGVGLKAENSFAKLLKETYNADCFYFDYASTSDQAQAIIQNISGKYDAVIIGLHAYKKYPANNFGISATSVDLLRQLSGNPNSVSFVFGNPYAIKNLSNAKNIVACYEDDPLMHEVAIKLLKGTLTAKGKLPVTVSPEFNFGTGIIAGLPVVNAESLGFNTKKLNEIDGIALDAIENGATPGAV
ncbi:MAG: glycoside hydrolase family 3 protein, partial [Sphingobacteriaceae bacterium]